MKYHIVWHSQKMQTAGSSKLLVPIRQTTQHHTPDTELHNHSYSNLKPYADVPYLLRPHNVNSQIRVRLKGYAYF